MRLVGEIRWIIVLALISAPLLAWKNPLPVLFKCVLSEKLYGLLTELDAKKKKNWIRSKRVLLWIVIRDD